MMIMVIFTAILHTRISYKMVSVTNSGVHIFFLEKILQLFEAVLRSKTISSCFMALSVLTHFIFLNLFIYIIFVAFSTVLEFCSNHSLAAKVGAL